MNQEIKQKLETLALKRSSPFCYHCYCECTSGRCETCGPDDLMRLLPEVGCEYGTEWVIEQILEAELKHGKSRRSFRGICSRVLS